MQLRQENPEALRVVGEMVGSDQIMVNTLFLGTYPGLTEQMLSHEISVITSFMFDRQLNPPPLLYLLDEGF